MTDWLRATLVLAPFLVVVVAAQAQDPGADKDMPDSLRLLHADYGDLRTHDDVFELIMTGLVYERDGLVVRAANAILILDRQEVGSGSPGRGRGSDLPRRRMTPPPSGRTLDEAALRDRLRSFLAAAGQRDGDLPLPDELRLELLRSVYLEGDVTVVQDGLEVVRAERMYFSVVDDRAVFHDVTLRLSTLTSGGRSLLVVVRGPKLVRQGSRITGRDLSVTTCTAGEPHFEVLTGEAEIIERENEFEIRSRDNFLAFSGTRVLPLPGVSFFTSDQNQIPIKRVSAGYSSKEGLDLQVVFGSTFNEPGGAVHEFLTGRSASEFRGDWLLGLGWIEERGFPIEPELLYRADGLYSGRTRGFYLDDSGRNIREIRRNFDGTLIDEDQRTLYQTENRVHFGEHTTLDLTAFDAGDPAVFSEFFSGDYYGAERPETSAHLRHGQGNFLATLSARGNLASFSYDDGRDLAARFVEELPHLTLDWFSEPLLDLPGDTPLLLTTSTGIAHFRSDFDKTFTSPIDDETFRFDQEIELAAPFLFGPLTLRPFASTRFTHYDETVAGIDRQRWAFETGVRLGTRLARTWNFAGDDGSTRSVRHVLSPTVGLVDRFKVDGDPTEFFQFDPIDALDEGTNVRVGLLQRLQHRVQSEDEFWDVRDFVWLDLAQNFTPNSERDNAGHHLGLFEFELIARPRDEWLGVPGLAFLTEGEHDWNDDELRTFNNYLQFEALGITWSGEYRTDQSEDGQVGYGARIRIRGRWTLQGLGRYDLQDDDHLNYSARLIRTDHDWRIITAVRYNEVTNDTSFTIEFEPKIGGLFRERSHRSVGGVDWGGGRYTEW